VCDKRAKLRKRSTSVCTEEAVGAAWEAITRNPRKCTPRLAQQIGVSTSTAWKICRDEMLLFLYKMQMNQPLVEGGIARLCAFAMEYRALLENNTGVMNVT
jgi:riboflavin biosynthesis pyrimidine reductase